MVEKMTLNKSFNFNFFAHNEQCEIPNMVLHTSTFTANAPKMFDSVTQLMYSI